MNKTVTTLDQVVEVMEGIIDQLVLEYPIFGHYKAPSVEVDDSFVRIKNGIDGIPMSLYFREEKVFASIPVVIYEDILLKEKLVVEIGTTSDDIENYMKKIILAVFKYIMKQHQRRVIDSFGC